MAKNTLTKITEVPIQGGPKQTNTGEKYPATPTRVGRYIINYVGKHISPGRYQKWSGIPWGTPLRLSNKNVAEVFLRGSWQNLTSVNGEWFMYQNKQDKVVLEILKYYNTSVASGGLLGYPKGKFPDKWVFNDFGHITVKYFKDLNNNGIKDKNEPMMSDFIHTTPDNEAETALGKNVELYDSHGCIHIKPNDIDDLIARHFIQKGRIIEVHGYNEIMAPTRIERSAAKPPYEIHVFPGAFKLAVYSVN